LRIFQVGFDVVDLLPNIGLVVVIYGLAKLLLRCRQLFRLSRYLSLSFVATILDFFEVARGSDDICFQIIGWESGTLACSFFVSDLPDLILPRQSFWIVCTLLD
jgi:hypothetical protein